MICANLKYNCKITQIFYPDKSANAVTHSFHVAKVRSLPFRYMSRYRLFIPQTCPFRIENPYIWKKLSLFSCIFIFPPYLCSDSAADSVLFIFPPYLCSDSAADSVPYLGILIIYCKHFTKIIPTLKIWKIFKSNGVMDSKCLRLSTDYVRSPICYRCIVLYRTSAGCCSIIVRRAFSRCLNVNNR